MANRKSLKSSYSNYVYLQQSDESLELKKKKQDKYHVHVSLNSAEKYSHPVDLRVARHTW